MKVRAISLRQENFIMAMFLGNLKAANQQVYFVPKPFIYLNAQNKTIACCSMLFSNIETMAM